MIELTDEMRRAVKGRMGIPDGVDLDPWMEAAIGDVLAIAERDQAAGLAKVKVSIDMHAGGAGRFIARIVLDCRCGEWGITATLANWSNLASVTESARLHLGACTS